MAFCHKCGSEIAGDTTFCPFCGVSTENTPVDAIADPTEFDNTLNMPFPDAVEAKAENAKPVEELSTNDGAANLSAPPNRVEADSDPSLIGSDEKVITNEIADSSEASANEVHEPGE